MIVIDAAGGFLLRRNDKQKNKGSTVARMLNYVLLLVTLRHEASNYKGYMRHAVNS